MSPAKRPITAAPWQSCVGCFKGDVTTAVVLEGEAEWIIAGMAHACGISAEEATATFESYAIAELGCDPGQVPDGRLTHSVRLCRECAAKTGTRVFDEGAIRSGEPVGIYKQQEA
jgi:hypothetical protein